ncbi:MAG TPA: hypothetical protein VKX33_04880 [Cyclobacteriaceae bacterium]|nr:hypothetical protein [Cyclobacteriaceae bacterium]
MDKLKYDIKTSLLEVARNKLQLQLGDIHKQLADLSSSSQGEGKSSAGDKYETQREMIKQSGDILDVQLSRVRTMINELEKIPCRVANHVEEGALVKLPIGLLWISVSLGKIIHEGTEYQLISKDSPLFLAIKGLKPGEGIVFRGKELIVEEII